MDGVADAPHYFPWIGFKSERRSQVEMTRRVKQSEEAQPRTQETPPPQVSGKVTFGCCGLTHTIEGDPLKHITCPVCWATYDLHLNPRIPGAENFPKGMKVHLTREVVTKAGCREVTLKEGQELTVGTDPHAVMGTLEDQTLVEVESPGKDGSGRTIQRKRILLAPVPNDAIAEQGVHDAGTDSEKLPI